MIEDVPFKDHRQREHHHVLRLADRQRAHPRVPTSSARGNTFTNEHGGPKFCEFRSPLTSADRPIAVFVCQSLLHGPDDHWKYH
jgi:hypothetical protein